MEEPKYSAGDRIQIPCAPTVMPERGLILSVETSRAAGGKTVLIVRSDSGLESRVFPHLESADLHVPQYDIGEGDTVTLPDGTKVQVQAVDHDDKGTFFTCIEDGESVFYYTDVLDSHPNNAALREDQS